jgi:hypothetical protein
MNHLLARIPLVVRTKSFDHRGTRLAQADDIDLRAMPAKFQNNVVQSANGSDVPEMSGDATSSRNRGQPAMSCLAVQKARQIASEATARGQ